MAPIAGAGTGVVDALFRFALEEADAWRNTLLQHARNHAALGFVLVLLGCAAAAALGAFLVRRFSPHAGGSGIPLIEAALNGDLPPAPPRLLPVKFFGGLAAIGSGIALGREGPSVQMGAGVAHLVGNIFCKSSEDLRLLLAAGAGPSRSTRQSPARCSFSKSWCAGSSREWPSSRSVRHRRRS